MSKLAKVLSKVFEGRDLVKDAKALGLTKDAMTSLLSGHYEISPKLAIQIAELPQATNTTPSPVTPKDILDAQTDDQLRLLGASTAKTPRKAAATSGLRAYRDGRRRVLGRRALPSTDDPHWR